MKEKVIDLTNAQVGDKFRRADGKVVTVVYRYRDIYITEEEALCIVDSEGRGCLYNASEFTIFEHDPHALIEQVDVPQMPAPGVPNPQAEGTGIPFSEAKLADAEKESRIARRERIAIEIVNKMEYIFAGNMKELIDDIEDAIVDIDEVKVKIADPDTL